MLGDIYDKIDSASWSLLDAFESFRIPLASFFEGNSIPPVVFPLTIITTVILLLFALPPGMPITCGDGTCAGNENQYNCAVDCLSSSGRTPGSKSLTVQLIGDIRDEVRIEVMDSSAEIVATQTGRKNDYLFSGLKAGRVFAVVTSKYGYTTFHNLMDLEAAGNVMRIPIPQDFFAVSEPTGSLTVFVRDNITGDLIDAKVTVHEVTQDIMLSGAAAEEVVNRTSIFKLPSGSWYVIFAERAGYLPYKGDPVFIDTAQLERRMVFMQPMPGSGGLAEDELEGEVLVCVRDDQDQQVSSGLITISNTEGGQLTLSDLAQSEDGCATFLLPAGHIIYASVTTPPDGCSNSPIRAATVPLQGMAFIRLDVTCGEGKVGYLKVKVKNETSVITDRVTVTLWSQAGNQIAGKGPGASLGTGLDGYTEELPVPAGIGISARVTGAPPGYLDYTSETVFLAPEERRAMDITLSYAGLDLFPSLYSFSGLGHPGEVETGSSFEVEVEDIFFAGSRISEEAEVNILIEGLSFPAEYNGSWSATCTAPSSPGEHELVVEALVQGRGLSSPSPFRTFQALPGSGRLEVSPLYQTDRISPINLEYNITFDGAPIDQLRSGLVTVESIDLPFTSDVALEFSAGIYRAQASVPFRGDYRAIVQVESQDADIVYRTEYVHTFVSAQTSPQLQYELVLPRRVIAAGEAFSVAARPLYDSEVLRGVDDLLLDMGGITYTMDYEPDSDFYYADAAINREGVYDLTVFLPEQSESSPLRIYVVDPEGEKSDSCPLDSSNPCINRAEMRRCVKDLLDGISPHSEQSVAACVNGWGPPVGSFSCTSLNKGDVNGDCTLTMEDVQAAQRYLTMITDPIERNQYSDCADMDLDGDVDQEDLDCLTKVFSGKWFGEQGGDCSRPMRGAFCFDLVLDSPLKGDLTGDQLIDADDRILLGKIIEVTVRGPDPSPEMLDALDFDQDGLITLVDAECIDRFVGVGLDELEPGEEIIPDGCFDIYGLECDGVKGDLDGDGDVTETDFLVLNLVVAGRADKGILDLACADINDDRTISIEDTLCVASLLGGDEERFLGCIQCDDFIPEDAYGMEICGDGLDNDCDGLIDRTSLNQKEDRCTCIPSTPCGMKYDADGGATPGVKDGNYYVCRDLSWDESGYRWIPIKDLGCTQDVNCETQICAGQLSKCSGPPGKWYSSGLPSEICGDGWDNDCSGGDAKCPTDSGGGGCLSVYSSDAGGSWVLDHLGYPFSIIPLWEDYSYGAMPHLEALDGILRVKLVEELPELTNINNVRLFKAGHPLDTILMPDSSGSLHTISDLQPPLSCISTAGDCTAMLAEPDGYYYSLDLDSLDLVSAPLGGIRQLDKLTLEFAKPDGVDRAKLLIRGRESGLITYVWWSILEMVGRDDMNAFLASMGYAGDAFQTWADTYGKVTISADGVDHPEYLAYFEGFWAEVVMSVELEPEPEDDILTVELSMAPGAFLLDSIQVDYSPDGVLGIEELGMVSAQTLDGIDTTSLIIEDDDAYFTTGRGGGVIAEFEDTELNTPDATYIIAVKGHYTYDIPSGNLDEVELALIEQVVSDPAFMVRYFVPKFIQDRNSFYQTYDSITSD